jgi:hypothetical protein
MYHEEDFFYLSSYPGIFPIIQASFKTNTLKVAITLRVFVRKLKRTESGDSILLLKLTKLTN